MNKHFCFITIFLAICFVFSTNSLKSQPQRNTNCWENVEIVSTTNALFAVDAQSRKPLWSKTGEFYRESFDFDDLDIRFDQGNEEENIELPQRMSVEHQIQFGRLYAVLDRSSIRPEKGNVLIAFDLTQEGKVVWRLSAPPKTTFQSIVSLIRDQLTLLLSDGTTLQMDAATGEIQ